MEPTAQRKLIERISEEGKKARQQGIKPVFLTSPDIRALFRTIVTNVVPNAAVLSSFEIVPDVRLESVGTIAY
jgi:flagellar biosynthesis component FlhA